MCERRRTTLHSTPTVTRRWVTKSGAAAGAFGLVVSGCARAQSNQEDGMADTIIRNARVTTLDPATPEADALAIRDGFILAAGPEAVIMRRADVKTQVIDAGGRRVIPGLNDSHTHLIRGGLNYNMELRWENVSSLADALRMLKDQADRTLVFLRNEFPEAFGKAKIRAYGLPGIRQTRWIVGTHHLTVDEVRAGKKFDDAIARCSWPLEQHHNREGYVWEVFDEDHVHTVPLGSITVAGADNLCAVGRCIDADSAALSSVRVMGPCIAMGAAAAHALDLAGSGSVHQIDIGALKQRICHNIEG